MEKLPDEIMVNILSRLALKTLFQCTRVCTTWRSIILRDPYFANMHLTRASQVYLPCLVYKTPSYPGEPPQLCLVDFNSDEGQDHKLNIESKNPFAIRIYPGIHFRIILSCNGLLCLCDGFNNNPIYVCNPVTGDHVALPLQWARFKDCSFIPGFGFDATNNEYKVIRIMYFDNGGEVASHLMAEVYTLGSGAWRSIRSLGCRVISERRNFFCRSFSGPVNIHGALHWMIEFDLNPTNLEIVACDVSDEKFRVVPLPEEFGPNKDFHGMRLTTIDKCLSILDPSWGFKSMNIWIMKDYNVKESWTKEVRYMDSFLTKAAIIRRWYRGLDALNSRSNIDVHVNAIYSCEERRFKDVYETRGCIQNCEIMDIGTLVGSFISVNGNSWRDGVGPNGGADR